jgi:hypothetical protein
MGDFAMGAQTLYHPVEVALIRTSLTRCDIVTGKFQQVRSDFEKCSATYDVTLKDLPLPFISELLNPREVRRMVSTALSKHEIGWGWYGDCESVTWRNNHWSARINVEILKQVQS